MSGLFISGSICYQLVALCGGRRRSCSIWERGLLCSSGMNNKFHLANLLYLRLLWWSVHFHCGGRSLHLFWEVPCIPHWQGLDCRVSEARVDGVCFYWVSTTQVHVSPGPECESFLDLSGRVSLPFLLFQTLFTVPKGQKCYKVPCPQTNLSLTPTQGAEDHGSQAHI